MLRSRLSHPKESLRFLERPKVRKRILCWTLATSFLLCAGPTMAQVPARVGIDGSAPDFSATPCPGEKSAVLEVRANQRTPISAASEANFHAHNPRSQAAFVDIIRYDGRSGALIPPTLDIDPEMHAAIAKLAGSLTIRDPLADCRTVAAVYRVPFSVRNGVIALGVPVDKYPAMVTRKSVTQSSFVGPTPNPRATPCRGENDPGRHYSGPHGIIVTSASAMDFFLDNPLNPQHVNTPQVLFAIELRLDGGASIRIPGGVVLDDDLRDEMLAYSRALRVYPPIPGCTRTAAVLAGSVSLRDGAIALVPITPGRVSAAKP